METSVAWLIESDRNIMKSSCNKYSERRSTWQSMQLWIFKLTSVLQEELRQYLSHINCRQWIKYYSCPMPTPLITAVVNNWYCKERWINIFSLSFIFFWSQRKVMLHNLTVIWCQLLLYSFNLSSPLGRCCNQPVITCIDHNSPWHLCQWASIKTNRANRPTITNYYGCFPLFSLLNCTGSLKSVVSEVFIMHYSHILVPCFVAGYLIWFDSTRKNWLDWKHSLNVTLAHCEALKIKSTLAVHLHH